MIEAACRNALIPAVLSIIMTGTSLAGPRSAAETDRVVRDLRAFLQSAVDDYELAGIGACVVKDGTVACSCGAGWADIGEKRPATAESIFNAGSVSKTVTLAAFMSLWERGLCSLDDDIDRYLSFPVRNPRFPDRPITIRMLLSFTAGIYDVDFQAGANRLDFLYETHDSPANTDDALREFLVPGGAYYSEKNYLEFAPGERYAYSNISYSLIGCLVERLSGKPFWEYCRERVFVPLEMNDSSWRLADLDRDRYAFGYVKESGSLRKVEPFTWPGYMDGGLHTTPKDMGNFLLMMANGGRFGDARVLKAATVDTMLALHNPPGAPAGRGFPTIGRGFVWILSDIKGRRIYQMNGFGPSFFAQVYFDPAGASGGAFFTTGGFESFQALGSFVRQTFDTLLAGTDKP
jgi:CubicO group peptidase (beta-lactamase class C family)